MTFFVGIDVSKETLQVACLGPLPSQNNLLRPTYPNTPKGLKQLLRHLETETFVVLEATGGYERLCAETLAKAGIPISVVNPKRVRDYARSCGTLAKTDAVDARVLADYAEHFHQKLPRFHRPPELQALQDLVNLRLDLVQSSVQYQNRLKLATPLTRPTLERMLASLKQELQAVETAIKQALKAFPEHAILKQATGVGVVVSATLLAHLPELGRVNKKEVAALVGLAPFNRDSGKFRGKQFCQGGRKTVRNALYLAAQIARRFDPKIKAYYEHLIAKGKPFKVAVTACARKLLVIFNAQLKEHYTLTYP